MLPASAEPVVVSEGGLDDPQVQALLDDHLSDMFATSPPESVHALDLDALAEPSVTFWTARAEGVVVGCAALKALPGGDGEIRSMRTTQASRGRGIGALLVRHLVGEGRRRGYGALCLETGTQEFFAPARRLYARHGFVECPPFGDYVPDPHSTFMRLDLAGGADA